MAVIDPRSANPVPMRWLLILNFLGTGATGIILIVAPAAIPASAGLTLNAGGTVLCYLYAASELSIAFLSFGALRLRDAAAVALIGWYFLAFHLLSVLAGLLGIARGASSQLLGNVTMHAIVAILFVAFVAAARRRAVSGSTQTFA